MWTLLVFIAGIVAGVIFQPTLLKLWKGIKALFKGAAEDAKNDINNARNQ